MKEKKSPLEFFRDKWMESNEGRAVLDKSILADPNLIDILQARLKLAYLRGAQQMNAANVKMMNDDEVELIADSIVGELGECVQGNNYQIKGDKELGFWIYHESIGSGQPLKDFIESCINKGIKKMEKKDLFDELGIGDEVLGRETLNSPWQKLFVQGMTDDKIFFEDVAGVSQEGTKEEINGGEFFKKAE